MYPGLTTSLLLEERAADAIRLLAEAGWPAVELSTEHLTRIDESDDPSALADDVIAAVEACGVRMPQAHLMISANVAAADARRRESDLATVERHIALCAHMGIEVGVIHPGGGQPATADQWRREAELRVASFQRIAAFADEHSFSIAIENTMDSPSAEAAMGRRSYGATIEELHELIDAIGRANVGICLDTGHANIQGIPLDEAVRQCGERLIATHIQDNDGVHDQHYAPPRGTINWPATVTSLREIGWEGIFNLEVGGERGRSADLALPTEQILARARAILGIVEWMLAG